MLPKYQPIKWEQGEDWTFTVAWKDASGNLVNLTGYSARMQVRKRFEDGVLIELTDTNARILMGGASGFVQLKLTASETAVVLSSDWANPHVYDLELTAPGGKVTKLMKGTLANLREVTR